MAQNTQNRQNTEKTQKAEKLTFKGFTLDPFQVDAVHAIEKNESVIVTAQTGSGKTLIADYVIDKFMHSGQRVVYTAPIKALSNQKFRDFKEDYGEENVGIMTGDVVINPGAPILIMTTEIYRNMLLCRDPSIDQISYVVFDEIHFINDIERGTIWEESLIFSPESVRFICLSATIPNAREFADWIESIHEHKVRVVTNNKRVVPLKHLLFDFYTGIATQQDVRKHVNEVKDIPEYSSFRPRRRQGARRKKPRYPAPSHVPLVEDLKEKNLLPAIYFAFSRKMCQDKAHELIKERVFKKAKDMTKILSVFNKHITPELKQLASSRLLKTVIQQGVAFHHAGMLPQQKEVVEELFAEGLIKMLYATETFAVGINMPAKAVCFNSLDKWDGISFRYLHTKEYFQLAGRAGRRGIDKEGYAIALFNRNRDDLDKIAVLTKRDIEPIISQFTLSYNTVLTLLDQHDHNEIEIILQKSFDYYLKKKKNKNIRIMARFKNKVKQLKKFGYVATDDSLTQKGHFARMIYAYELEVAELCTSGIANELDDVSFLTLLAAIMYEGKRGTKFYQKCGRKHIAPLLKNLGGHGFLAKRVQIPVLKNLYPIIHFWYNGGDFVEMMEFTNLLEGDYIRMFRQLLDMLKQIKRPTDDYDLIEKLERCIVKLDRDVVKVEL